MVAPVSELGPTRTLADIRCLTPTSAIMWTAALRQEQSFNNDQKALIGNRPSGPYIVARMEPVAHAKITDAGHPAFRLGYDGGITRSSIRIGNRRKRTPVACQTAFATAPADPVTPISPTPLMPRAFTCGSCSSIMSASRLGN